MTAGYLESKRAMADDMEAAGEFCLHIPRIDESIHASMDHSGYGAEVQEALMDVHCCIYDLFYELWAAKFALMDELRGEDQ